MLTPEQMDDAGDLVADVYRQIEAEMLQYLTRKMIEGDVTGQRSQTAILLLAQSHAVELQKIIESHAGELDEAVIEEVEEAIGKSDRQDVAKIERGLGVSLPLETRTVQTAATVAGIREIIARDNVEMNNAARSSFFQWSTWGITQVNTGAMTAEQAMHKAVRELSRRGLNITEVSYRNPETGEHTVTNHVDVAVKRHIRTQLGQDAARLTEKRLDEGGCEFVEVSSHCGARPSHREWHGRVYHRGGDIVYNGEHYADFHYGTGYERICGPYTSLADCLLGVNCRHSFGPWIPGTPRAYDEDPEHPSGLSNEELYDLSQRQRDRERDIRATKRELAAAQQLYEASPTTANQVEVSKLQARLRNQQANMRQFISEANAKGKPGTTVLRREPHREWAGDMPKAGTPGAPANRSLDKFMSMPSTKKKLEAAGVSKTAARKQIVERIDGNGIDTRGFRWLTPKQQADTLDAVIAQNRKMEPEPSNRKPVNEHLYNSLRNRAERRGAVVMRGGDEVHAHLERLGAGGSTVNDVVMLRDDATTSEVLEEFYHLDQYYRGDYADRPPAEMVLRREIDAQNYLLGVTERYNIPVEETETTKANLEKYKRDLDELDNENR